MTDKCSVCGFGLRPYRTKLADFPGTRGRVKDKCRTCYDNKLSLSDEALAQREQSRQDHLCRSCKRPMRPPMAKAADHPGTMRMAALGKCDTCYKRAGLKGGSFVKDSDIEKLDAMYAPIVTTETKKIVRRLIQDRFDGDDYLLYTLGLVGEDV